MPGRLLLILLMLGGCWGLALGQTAATAPTSQAASDELEALKQKIREQERRLAQLEALKGEDTVRQIQREELLKLLKEMKVEADKHSDLRVYWKEGIRMDTGDGDFKLHLGTRIQTDWNWIKPHDFEERKPLGIANIKDGAELRRAYLILDGQIYKNIEFKFEYDFVGLKDIKDGDKKTQTIGTPKPQDVYVKMNQIPVMGDFTVGHFKEPYSLEQLTSDANTTFMERALSDALVPGRDLGFQAHNSFLTDSSKTDRMTYAAGFFRENTKDYGIQQADEGYAGTFRLTGLPWYENKGQQLLHLGVDFSVRQPDPSVRYRQRPEDHLAPYLVDTGSIATRATNLYGGEVATVIGPWHAEGEFDAAAVSNTDGGSECVNGFYVQTGYFLTGESRPYKTTTATWDRVRPKKNFREDGGWGAWEVAGRFSYLNLNSNDVEGGKMKDLTAGVNWYLNPCTKVMWNYIHSMQETWATSSDAFMMRFQIDF